MSQENVELVLEQFEATNRREFDVPVASWAEDIELITRDGDINTGTYLGREVVAEFFGGWFRAFGEVHFEVLDIRSAGDSVAVMSSHRARGRHSDVEVSETFFHEYRLHGGKVIRIRFHNSWEEALEAVGLREGARRDS
jgi:ketosteroid isomerase-like protein